MIEDKEKLFRKAYTDYKAKAEAELEAEEEKVKIEEEKEENKENKEELLLDDVATKLKAVEVAIEKQL